MAEQHNMTPSILVITNSENGFSHVRHKAITWTTDDVLFIESSKQISLTINIKKVNQENTFENVVCKMTAIFFRPQWVKQDLMPKSKWWKILNMLLLYFPHYFLPTKLPLDNALMEEYIYIYIYGYNIFCHIRISYHRRRSSEFITLINWKCPYDNFYYVDNTQGLTDRTYGL